MSKSGSTRAIWYALGANLAIMAVKLSGALYTGSGALLAEAMHSFADTGNQGLLLWGQRRARRAPSAQYPLGHGREIYFWSFVVALLLFSMGGLFSIFEGVEKLYQHQSVRDPWIAIGIVAFSLVAEAISLRAALREVNKTRGRRSLWRWFRETRRSEVLVVLSEDSAALVGLCFALTALVAMVVLENAVFDAIGSIAIGLLLVAVAFGLAAEIKSLLIGESAHPELQRAMEELLRGCPRVRAVRSLITVQHGHDVLLFAQLGFDATCTLSELGVALKDCKQQLRGAFPQIVRAFLEPTPM